MTFIAIFNMGTFRIIVFAERRPVGYFDVDQIPFVVQIPLIVQSRVKGKGVETKSTIYQQKKSKNKNDVCSTF